ncbi:MFS transporter [Streptomyces sulfonofaciens]|uniref:MFS transporter n=1 Tax=Streptomyces sulfonofaciens TaxID=68272 RepID=A0A919L0Q7_9ACTN|nr:MFS transporter [Streptomyces sulfonofaciens]GHH79194.1 MFS transporter [Streptomyces sulfonofaciens]
MTSRPPRNGRAAIMALTYLGFALQMVQVGLLPLLPEIGAELGASPAGTSWILTSGLLSGAVFLAVLTRLGDLIGKRPVILLAMSLVVVGCVIDTFATTLPLVLLGRVLIGAQLPMLALPVAIANDTLEPKRAHGTISSIHVCTGLGIAAGLLLGSFVGRSWHLYFAISAVAALIGLVATALLVHDSPRRATGGLDLPGAGLLTLALVAVLLGLSEGSAWGWGSAGVVSLLVGGAVLFGLWWLRERTAQVPLIKVGYLVQPHIGIPYAMTFLVAFGIYGSLSAVTRLAQTPLQAGFGFGWSGHATAWFAVPQAVGPALGTLVLRWGRQRGLVMTAAISFCLIIVGFAGYAVGHSTPLAELVSLAPDSMGLAIALAATQLLVLSVVPAEESGIALGLSVVMYAVGQSLGSAVVGVYFASFTTPAGLPALGSYLAAFATCGGAAVVALLLCVPLARSRTAGGTAGGTAAYSASAPAPAERDASDTGTDGPATARPRATG